MKSVDYLIVGSGLTGGVIARMLSDVGREVLIVESRNHFGGNVYDYKHPSGVRVHAYGPHYANQMKFGVLLTGFQNFMIMKHVLKL